MSRQSLAPGRRRARNCLPGSCGCGRPGCGGVSPGACRRMCVRRTCRWPPRPRLVRFSPVLRIPQGSLSRSPGVPMPTSPGALVACMPLLLVDHARPLGAEPAVDCEVSDPGTGKVLAIAEACWPEGLQPGQGDPVILELDPAEADLPRLKEIGYEVFT